jgi:multiple sugar transport system permease protein
MSNIYRPSLKQPRSSSRRQSDWKWGGKSWMLTITLGPLLAAYLLFWIYPIVATFIYSFSDWAGFQTHHAFVGIDNYSRAVQDPIFRRALVNTLAFALIYLPLVTMGGLLLAMLVNAAGRLKDLFRMIYFFPVVTSVIATAFVWRYLYQPRFGIFNVVLEAFNLPGQMWLLDPRQALLSIVLFTAWQSIGLNMVWFMAGLSTIDGTFYDAARVDGANRWQSFRHVTLPLLRPTFAFVSITSMINALQIFAPVYIMTSSGLTSGESPPGGPSNSTMVIVLYQWLTAFKELNLGYGAAMGVILLVFILVFTLLQFRFFRTKWEY